MQVFVQILLFERNLRYTSVILRLCFCVSLQEVGIDFTMYRVVLLVSSTPRKIEEKSKKNRKEPQRITEKSRKNQRNVEKIEENGKKRRKIEKN